MDRNDAERIIIALRGHVVNANDLGRLLDYILKELDKKNQ